MHSLDIVEHHADTAALLLDGVVAKRWMGGELERLRLSEEHILERAFAEVSNFD